MRTFKPCAFLMIVLSLGLSSCASLKKSSFELNGDSDSSTAGGLQTVNFDFNSAALTSTARDQLENNADFLKKNPTVKVQIEGHCDERGGVQYNLALGERRAKAVRRHLISLGIQGRKMGTISYGKERPLEVGHDEDTWEKNRRATFVITAK